MNIREVSLEVLVTEDPLVTVKEVQVEELTRRALASPKHRARLCAHRSADDAVHEMIIALTRDCYVRPHRHVGKCESFHIIRGELDLILFDEAGMPSARIELGPYGSGRPFYYRNEASAFHTVIVRSKIAVMHESTVGPFRSEDTIYASWAPDESDATLAAAFRDGLIHDGR